MGGEGTGEAPGSADVEGYLLVRFDRGDGSGLTDAGAGAAEAAAGAAVCGADAGCGAVRRTVSVRAALPAAVGAPA